ncbi:MAG: DUF4214 domain-containing protein [Epsilonproteobacteria bacterium]|nr:DUF4214 domain-containing protein [Campylobacterota bacterium]
MRKLGRVFLYAVFILSIFLTDGFAKDPAKKVEDFVHRLYKNILNREPDNAGSNFWVKKLLYENVSATNVAHQFFLSKEFEEANLSNEEFVKRMYKTLLDREPEPTGLAYWVNEIEKHGKLRDQIFYGFALSDEFTKLCHKDYEVLAHDKNDEREAFIERFYNIVLGRRADRAGLDYWNNELRTKAKSAKDIALGFFNSKEFKNRNLNDEDFLTVVYRTLMNREPDKDGLEFWKKKLKEGAGRDYVVKAFLDSPEFKNITESYLGKYNVDIRINEIMAANTKTVYDGDFFNFSDWIELKSQEAKDINLSGYYLSDDINEKKFKIGDVVIKAKGYLLAWADEENATLKEIHTNFKLSTKGESVVLFDPNGDVVSYMRFREQDSDISYGRSPKGEFVYMQPTPLDPNLGGLLVLKRSDEPEFSVEGGFYKDGITLSFTNVSDKDEIYYTLDGSEPNKHSLKYTSPIKIDKNTVVRAVRYSENLFGSKVVTNTYFINENSTLPVVSLSIDPKFLYDDEIGIYTVGKNGALSPNCFGPKVANFFQDWERAANVEYFDKDKKKAFNINVGVEIMGKCSRTVPQKSFAVKLKKKYGVDKLEYKLFDDKNLYEFEDFVLRNSGNDWGKSMLRDAFMQTLIKDTTDIDRQAYKPALVFLNGEFWGLYNIREKINKDYLKNNHNVKKVDLLENNKEVLEGDAKAYEELIEYIKNNDLSIKENYDYVVSKIDINEFMDYEISEIFFGNWDWPGNNVRYWRERKDDSKWRWIMFDTDFGFSLRDSVAGVDYNLLEVATSINDRWPNPEWSTFLLRNLLKNEDFKERFIDKFMTHLSFTFNPDRVKDILDNLSLVIEPEIPRAYKRWPKIHLEGDVNDYYSNYTSIEEWRAEIDKMKSFADNRPAVVKNQLKNKFSIDADEVTLSVKSSKFGKVKIEGILVDGDFNGKYFKGEKISIKALPNEGYKLSSWKGFDGADEKIEVVMDGDKEITPIFTLANPPKVVINEFNYKSAKDFDTGDWVELYNNSDEDVDIGGWILKDDDDDHQFIFEPGLTIPARGYLVVCEDMDKFKALFPNVSEVTGNMPFGLGKKGDAIRLYNKDGILIDQVVYDKSWDGAYGNGATFELIDPNSDNSLKENWRESNSTTHGTPAAANVF